MIPVNLHATVARPRVAWDASTTATAGATDEFELLPSQLGRKDNCGPTGAFVGRISIYAVSSRGGELTSVPADSVTIDDNLSLGQYLRQPVSNSVRRAVCFTVACKSSN